MFGYQEILIISAIIVGVLVVPRVLKPPPRQAPRLVKPKWQLTAGWRLAIAASVIYPFVVAAYMQPWRNDMIAFFYAGIGPVVTGWLLFWVIRGFLKK